MKTLLRHSAIYLLARGVPGAVNFLAIAMFTRLLPPKEYGRYALVIAGSGLVNVMLFHWLSLSLLRYFVGSNAPLQLLATVRVAYRCLAALTAIAGFIALFWVPPDWQLLVAAGILLLWTQTWFEMNVQALRAKLAPVLFGLISVVKAVLTIGVGLLLIEWFPNALAPTLGHVIGFALASALVWGKLWSGVGNKAQINLLREVVQYGAPLGWTLVVAYLLGYSDRFLIAYFIDEHAAGVYAAGYDLGSQVIFVAMSIINTASYPLILNDMESKGVKAARQQLSRNMWLLLTVAAPAAGGMVIFAPEIATTILGTEFHETAIRLIPWIAVASLLNGLRSYHFDLAFQLSNNTVHQLWVMGMAIAVNFVLNLLWIPQKGIIGAAWATLAAYVVALLASVMLGKRFFDLPINWKAIGQVGVAIMLMFVLWHLLPPGSSVAQKLLNVGVLLSAYGGTLTLMAVRSSGFATGNRLQSGSTRRTIGRTPR